MSRLSPPDSVAARLRHFRAELSDIAYDLETRGRPDAADVANLLASRVDGLAAELEGDGVPERVREAGSFLP